MLIACASTPERKPLGPKSDPVSFAYSAPNGDGFTSEMARGRATVLVFLTTYDLASQAQARRIDEVVRSHRPRANAAAILLEAPRYGIFAQTFRETLGLSYPVVLADHATLQGHGPFGRLGVVPTVIILDARGRVRFRHDGPTPAPAVHEALTLSLD
jgi:hypothetical protein